MSQDYLREKKATVIKDSAQEEIKLREGFETTNKVLNRHMS